jgi:DNA gyrase subunit A
MTNGIEFVTSRKTITCSKMSNDDELVAIDYSNPQHLIVQSSADFVLRIKLNDIPEQKRNSSGAKCMSLKENEFIKNAYFVLPEQKEIHINGRKIPVLKIKLCGRATVGQKIK